MGHTLVIIKIRFENHAVILHFPLLINYRNTPLKLPWATISSPPGPDGQSQAYENLNLEGLEPRGGH
jgi:hypothetical protein